MIGGLQDLYLQTRSVNPFAFLPLAFVRTHYADFLVLQAEEAGPAEESGALSKSAAMKAYLPSYDDERVTYVQISAIRPLKLLCSPKAVKIAENIVASLEKVRILADALRPATELTSCQNYEPEHWLDELDGVFRKALPIPVFPERHESLYATVDVPVTSLLLVQDVLRPGDLNLPSTLEEDIASDASILSTSQLVLKKVQFTALSVQGFQAEEKETHRIHPASASAARYRSSSGEPVHAITKRKELYLRLGKGRLAVKHVSSPSAHVSPRVMPVLGIPLNSPGTVLETIFDGLEAFAEMPEQYQKVSIKLLDCKINAVSSAAELVTGTVHSWLIVSRAIEEAVYKAHYRSISSYRRLVTDILQLAHKEEIVTDPLFLNRPTAAAVHLRSNTDWKIMAHLRHVLRRLSPSSCKSLEAAFASAGEARNDFRQLVSRLQEWHNWELDEMVIRRLPLIQFLFADNEILSKSRDLPEIDSSPQETQYTDIELSAATSQFMVSYFEGDQCTNKLVLAPIRLYAIQNTSKLDAAILRITLGPLWIQLDPGVLRLIVHISKVRRVFRSKLEPLIPRPYAAPRKVGAKEQCPSHSVPTRLSILSEAVDLSTHASGVRASFTANGFSAHVSAIVRIGASGFAFDEVQVSIGADNVKLLAVSEGRTIDSTGNHERGGTLLSAGLERLSMHATYHSVKSAIERQVHLWAAVGSSRVRVPRSILKMSQL